MMKIFGKQTRIDFMGKRVFAMILSISLILASIVSLAIKGLNFGIDFTGGTEIQVAYPQSIDVQQLRKTLGSAGFRQVVVQQYGSSKEVLIRIAPQKGMTQSLISQKVLEVLRKGRQKGVELRSVNFIGPQIGEELTEQGGLAILYALIGILIYVTLRFEWKYSVGSVIALIHDVTITLGVFSFWQLDFSLSVLAALLAVIGYSLNDTIVVFDRIRENFRKIRKSTPAEVMNTSINQTLSRTIMTSMTTLLVLIALFTVGGEAVHNFSLALIIGIVVGTYSSIYVASTAALALGACREDLLPVVKEGAEERERPRF